MLGQQVIASAGRRGADVFPRRASGCQDGSQATSCREQDERRARLKDKV